MAKDASRDGRRLEALVAYVERTLVPKGFTVTNNNRVFNDDGVQIAEFDVLIKGRVGANDFQWLIECRDRPSSGAAPTAWVEQLVGRRIRFNLDKVTAVSTTGFAAGAHEFAYAQAIELREVADLTPEHFSDWLEVRYITNVVRHTTLTNVFFTLEPDTSKELHDALRSSLAKLSANKPVLKVISTGQLVSPAQAFSGVASMHQELFDDLIPNSEPKLVRLTNRYLDNDRFVIETPLGAVPIKEITFSGELRLKETQLPIVYAGEYRDSKTGNAISRIVTFAPQSIMGEKFAVELHKLAESGETHVTMRRV